jgi:hypothetical protein
MANTIDWGKLYCSTWFGDISETTDAIPSVSAPACWAGQLILSADDVAYLADTTLFTADAIEE